MIETIIQYVASPLLIALSGYIVTQVKGNRKVTDANAKGTMLLLRRNIIEAHKRYVVNKEPMSAFDYDDLQEIHDAYKGLEGNGLTDKMWDEIDKVHLEGGNQ